MATPTMTIQERLVEARHAYHQLLTGSMPRVVVDQNGERVEFVAANMSKLAAYIIELERQLAGSFGSSGPARFLF